MSNHPESDDSGEKAGITQASDSLARPSQPTPSPTGTELALNEAKRHIEKLTITIPHIADGQENNDWWIAADEARSFISGIPSSSPSPAVRDAPYGKCVICGEPMPKGEEMFKFHGYSGDCPKPPLSRAAVRDVTLREALERLANAADNVGVKFFDTDTMAPEVEEMQAATQAARAALSHPSLPDGEGKP